MPLPPFDEEGNLPPGVYRVSLSEALARLGEGTAQRRIVAFHLQRIHQLAVSTGGVARFIVFGSFVTAKAEPNDVDIILLMEDAFDVNLVMGEAAFVFQHMRAHTHLGASVFWTTRSGALGGETAFVERWQIRRDGGLRGIIEIVEEAT